MLVERSKDKCPMISGRTDGEPRIAFASCGTGDETIFFLHGIGGNKDNWTQQLGYFAEKGFRAVAWDVRGYGDSDDYDGSFKFDEISADLVRLMSHLGVSKAHFVGLSMGGRILMDFAYRHPSHVRSLVICAAFPSFGKALSAEQREDYLRLRKRPLLEGRTFAELAPELIASLAGPDAQESVRQALGDSIRRLRKDSYLKALEAAAYFDRSTEVQAIRAPTLLLYGEGDRLTPPDMGRQVAALMPHAQMHIIKRCGHLMNLEAPDAFNQVVHQFISKEQHHE
ncbi:MAG TPA: alpha/beta hydrolase [Pusillimonas sp.]|uniref:alpha/beta fold hydrolase n=1 Tax=Pusillimonas sp. TaxID=3040095 RepID=UPI002C264BA6|nr:alpha/beta hydrolase [Pusillimonas sp.]HUH87951.1 alpha/beta hydrolase [Pusillimonas sp.]